MPKSPTWGNPFHGQGGRKCRQLKEESVARPATQSRKLVQNLRVPAIKTVVHHIIHRHIAQAVKDAGSHFKVDKVVNMLQLTFRTQKPSTFSHAKGPRLYEARSRKRHTCPRSHGARGLAKGTSSVRSEVAKRGTLVLVHTERGDKQKRIVGSAWLCSPDGP